MFHCFFFSVKKNSTVTLCHWSHFAHTHTYWLGAVWFLCAANEKRLPDGVFISILHTFCVMPNDRWCTPCVQFKNNSYSFAIVLHTKKHAAFMNQQNRGNLLSCAFILHSFFLSTALALKRTKEKANAAKSSKSETPGQTKWANFVHWERPKICCTLPSVIYCKTYHHPFAAPFVYFAFDSLSLFHLF